MSEKRRRARIQGGGWASSSKTNQNECKEPAKEQRRQNFQFKPNVEIKTKPTDIVIKESGKHELSSTKNGISRIILKTGFINAEDSEWMFQQLLNEIPWKRESIIIKGGKMLQPRLTAWFGDMNYTYSGLTLTPYQFSPLLMVLKDRIEIYMKDIKSVSFNSVLANLYNNEKDSIDWHSDDETSLGNDPVIASLSFGETRTFEMRKKNEDKNNFDYTYAQHVKIPLPSGSLLIMDNYTQKDWQHRVAKEYHDRKARINLTFRTIHP